MHDFILQFMNSYGYLAVLILIVLENVFPPIPSEIILTFGGFMAKSAGLSLPLVILTASIASLLGAYVLYGLGRILSEERLRALFDSKPVRALGFRPKDITVAVGWFATKGTLTVFFCRFIPIVRSIISIPAGTAKMNLGLFSIYTFLGSLIWNTLLCSLGFFFGAAWEQVADAFDAFSSIMLGLFVILFLIAVYIVAKKVLKPRIEQVGEQRTDD